MVGGELGDGDVLVAERRKFQKERVIYGVKCYKRNKLEEGYELGIRFRHMEVTVTLIRVVLME